MIVDHDHFPGLYVVSVGKESHKLWTEDTQIITPYIPKHWTPLTVQSSHPASHHHASHTGNPAIKHSQYHLLQFQKVLSISLLLCLLPPPSVCAPLAEPTNVNVMLLPLAIGKLLLLKGRWNWLTIKIYQKSWTCNEKNDNWKRKTIWNNWKKLDSLGLPFPTLLFPGLFAGNTIAHLANDNKNQREQPRIPRHINQLTIPRHVN